MFLRRCFCRSRKLGLSNRERGTLMIPTGEPLPILFIPNRPAVITLFSIINLLSLLTTSFKSPPI